MSQITFESCAKTLMCDRSCIAELLWKAVNEGGDLAANDPKPDERIPIGSTDV